MQPFLRWGRQKWSFAMKKPTAFFSLVAVAALATAGTVAAEARGDPRRSSETPPGLSRVIEKMVPGIGRAILATEGSNSRLQEPISG
jgi:hypothetical protein